MGTDKIKIDREPDYRKVAKNLVEVERPCVTELSALLECMRRVASSSDADKACERERIALQACTRKMGAVSVRAARNNMYVNLQKLAKSWKRFGY